MEISRKKREHLITSLDEFIAPIGYRIIEWDLSIRDKILQIYIDHRLETERHVDIQDCVRVTKILNQEPVLDEFRDFTLEISSPGIERPLRLSRDFEAAVGKTIRVVLPAAEEFVGVLSKGDETGIFLLETNQGQKTFSLDLLVRGNLVYDF